MKKITLMLAFLGMVFSSVQSAFADDAKWEGKRIASVSAAVKDLASLTDGCYLMRNVGHMSYLRENDNKSLYLWNAVPSGSTEVSDINAVFAGTSSTISSVVYVSKNMTTKEDGTQEPTGYYTIQFRSGQYIGTSIAASAGRAASSNATAGEIEIVATTTATQFNFHPKDARWADGNGNKTNPSAGTFTDWSTTAPGAGGNGAYQFYPVTLEDNPVVTVTWTVKAGENTITTFTTTADKNSTVALPTFEKSYFFTDATLVTPENTTITEDNCNFTINVTEGTAPYTASTAAAPVWYNIKFRNDDNHYLNHVLSTDEGIGTQRANTIEFFKSQGGIETFNGGLWAFVKNGLGVKLLNKQTGKFVKATTTNGAAASLVADADATTFYVKENTFNSGAGFSLQVPGDEKAFIGDHATARLGVWNPGTQADAQNDGGSCFQIALADTEENLTIGKELLTTALNVLTPNEEDATYVTVGTQASIDAAKATVDGITSVNDINSSVTDMVATTPVFEADAYYRIVNCNTTKKYLSSAPIFVGTDGTLATSYHAGISGDRVVRRVAAGEAFVPQLWQFVSNGNNTYKIKNANTGCRLSSNANPIDMPIDVNAGGNYSMKVAPSATFSGNDGKTMMYLLLDGHHMNAYGGNNNDIMAAYDENLNDKGSFWQFEKVTEVPVAISEANYATVGFPFAVQVPAESGVKAFYVSSIANGTIALTEIENGIIPANQGAILYHEGATDVNLAITTTDATIEGNLLTATAAKRVGYEANANYLLALNEANNAAFLQSELTSVPANKAFINAENVPATEAGAATLNFVFNGTTTGINGVAADNANNTEYFDLSGRRVLYPANGIFVTKAGKKVFIK